jgi:two-component system, NarL family, nitrate/nitrite response regulator NarL
LLMQAPVPSPDGLVLAPPAATVPDLGWIRVLIVDRERLFAEALGSLLEHESIAVYDVVHSIPQAIATARHDEPDVVLLALDRCSEEELGSGALILEAFPNAKVLVLGGDGDRWAPQQAMGAGFHGYLTKDATAARLVESIRCVADGEEVFAPPVRPPRRVIRTTPMQRDVESFGAQLTAREREVLQLITSGGSGRSIARTLGITENTVRTHVQSILVKLQVHSRLEAAALAMHHGLTRSTSG